MTGPIMRKTTPERFRYLLVQQKLNLAIVIVAEGWLVVETRRLLVGLAYFSLIVKHLVHFHFLNLIIDFIDR